MFPKIKIMFFYVLCSPKLPLFLCFIQFLTFVPLFPWNKWPYSPVPQNNWEGFTKTRWLCHVFLFLGRVPTFLNARFKGRKLTFLRLYPTDFHKTKRTTYANMNTFHKHIAYLYPACSNCKHSKQMLVLAFSTCSSRKLHLLRMFANTACRYAVMFMTSAHIRICDILCLWKSVGF